VPRPSRFILSFIYCAFSCAHSSPTSEQVLAPDFQARLLDGTPYSLVQQRGKVVVLHFWATWCEACQKEMPALDAYFLQHQSQGLQVVAISLDDLDQESKVRQQMKKYSFAGALNHQTQHQGYGRIWRLPMTFVIDREGRLQKDSWSDQDGLSLAVLDQVLTPLLKGKE